MKGTHISSVHIKKTQGYLRQFKASTIATLIQIRETIYCKRPNFREDLVLQKIDTANIFSYGNKYIAHHPDS